MKISVKYIFKIFLVFFVLISLSAPADGQAVSQVKKVSENNKVVKQSAVELTRFVDLKSMRYSGWIKSSITSGVSVYFRRHTSINLGLVGGSFKKWMTKNFKMTINGVNIPRSGSGHNFRGEVSYASNSLNLLLEQKNSLNNSYSTILTGTGNCRAPVTITYPPYNYVYKIKNQTIGLPFPVKKKGLKVSWTPTTKRRINVALCDSNYHIIESISSGYGKNHVIFLDKFFQPDTDYFFLITQNSGSLLLSGKFEAVSKIKILTLIFHQFSTK